jgi:hypothetical protein
MTGLTTQCSHPLQHVKSPDGYGITVDANISALGDGMAIMTKYESWTGSRSHPELKLGGEGAFQLIQGCVTILDLLAFPSGVAAPALSWVVI